MKKALFAFLIIFVSVSLYSQAPEGFSYYAIVRNNAGNPLVSRTVSFRFSILKGSLIGSIIYGEKHNAATDQFGVLSLVIGNGTDKTGDFTTIDWGGDSYFLMVEIDTTGGASYTDMGTTQLLSVPYSLYSKTAANGFSGNFDDLTNKPITDGSETKISAGNFIAITGSGTVEEPYVISNILSGDYNDLINKPITDGSETKVIVGNNLTITGSGTNDNPYSLDSRTHYIGEVYGGGIVFYVYDKGQHGLIAATKDQDMGIAWYNGNKRYTNTTGDGIGAGIMNTTLIIALQTNDNPMGNFAAKVCADYSLTVEGVNYGDWYLPSKFELFLLFFQKDVVGNFANDYYWSSTEFSSLTTWSQNFSNGNQQNMNKSSMYGVRSIRAF